MLDAADVGPPWSLDQQRRPFLRPRRIVGIAGRVEQAEGRFPACCREFHAFNPRKVVAEMQVGTIENVGRPLQHGVPTGPKIECHDAGRMVGRTAPSLARSRQVRTMRCGISRGRRFLAGSRAGALAGRSAARFGFRPVLPKFGLGLVQRRFRSGRFEYQLTDRLRVWLISLERRTALCASTKRSN